MKLNTFDIKSRNTEHVRVQYNVQCTMFAAQPGNYRDDESVRGSYEYDPYRLQKRIGMKISQDYTV